MIEQWKINYLYSTVSCTVSKDNRTIKIMLFNLIAAWAMKNVLLLHILQWKSYMYITFNKIILFVKNILAYCEYSPTSPFFLLCYEHKHCNNATTNSNSHNARSRMLTSFRGSVRMGTKEDESSTERFWSAGFHHVMAHCCLARVLKLMNGFISLIFQNIFRTAVNHG